LARGAFPHGERPKNDQTSTTMVTQTGVRDAG
jgi:hypothetical protein